MKKTNILKALIALSVCAVCAIAFAGCSSKSGDLEADTGLTGGVAATVNGSEIPEDNVTRLINNMRIYYGLKEDDAWRSYLESSNATPESLRYSMLGTFINQKLTEQCADQLGITVDEDDLQAAVDKMASNYSSEEAWENALKEAGYSNGVEDYKDKLNYDMISEQLQEIYSAEAEKFLEDEGNLLEAAQERISTHDGSKRTSRILLDADDEQLAQQVYEDLSSGKITFANAVFQYSIDDETRDDGGDMGWSSVNSSLYSSEYNSALDGLDEGGISEPVSDDDGISIITVTDVYNAPEELTSLSDIPEGILDRIKTSAQSFVSRDLQAEWLESLKATNEITVNPMPNNVPYNINMSSVYSNEEIVEINETALDKLIGNVEDVEDDVDEAEAEGAEADELDAEAGEETAE